jgi:hypothetical protein
MTELSQANQDRVNALQAPFRSNQVLERQGVFNRSTGKTEIYKYVTAEDVFERLREVFGTSFSTRIPGLAEQGINGFVVDTGSAREVVVPVELSWFDGETGMTHSVVGWGSKETKGTDVGGAFKAATSKAVKSAAKVIGVPIDGGEFEPGDEDEDEAPAATARPAAPNKPAQFGGGGAAPVPPRPAPPKAAPAKVAESSDAEEPVAEEKPKRPEPPKGPAKSTPPVAGAAAPTRPAPPKAAPAPVVADESEQQDEEGQGEEDDEGAEGGEFMCTECQGQITDSVDADGVEWTAQELVAATSEPDVFGRAICAECMVELNSRE